MLWRTVQSRRMVHHQNLTRKTRRFSSPNPWSLKCPLKKNRSSQLKHTSTVNPSTPSSEDGDTQVGSGFKRRPGGADAYDDFSAPPRTQSWFCAALTGSTTSIGRCAPRRGGQAFFSQAAEPPKSSTPASASPMTVPWRHHPQPDNMWQPKWMCHLLLRRMS